MGAAIGGRDGVAIIAVRPLRPERPSDRPFDQAVILAGEGLFAGEELAGRAFAGADLFLEMIGEPARELEGRLGRSIVADQRRIAFPANLHPGIEIGLGAGETHQPPRLEMRAGAENLRIGREGNARAAPVRCCTELLELRHRMAALETLAEQLLVARDLDDGFGRERIDHRNTDTMQAARCGIGLAIELAA